MSLVVVGAGECGVNAAFAPRDNGYDGEITLLGEEHVLPYERPPLSKDASNTLKSIRSEQAYEPAQIDLRPGCKVMSVDCEAQRVAYTDSSADTLELTYDKLLLATGANARILPGMEGCVTLRTHRDAEYIVKQLKPAARIGLIGGGFIGLKLAAMAASGGAAVTVFEASTRKLSRGVPQDIADLLHARHEDAGVQLLTGVQVSKVESNTVFLSYGVTEVFDLVVLGVGSEPNVQLAFDAGLSVNNGIVVDERFCTDDSRVFAAGDCCSFPRRGNHVRLESWRAAHDQGTFAASALLPLKEYSLLAKDSSLHSGPSIVNRGLQ